MPEPRELILLNKATRTLAQATTIDEVKDLRDKATAVKAYIQKAQLGQQLLIDAAVFRLRAERRLGEMLVALQLADAAPGNQYTDSQDPSTMPSDTVFLRDLGISKQDSSRSQRIAGLPHETFEQYLTESAAAQRQPTLTGLLRLTKKHPAQINSAEGISVLPVDGSSLLADIIAGDQLFATIYTAPPWPQLRPGQSGLDFSLKDLSLIHI